MESDIVANAIRRGEIFEEQVVRVAERYIRPGSCVLDVGANFGQMTLAFSRLVGEHGRVYAFEADEFVFSVLQRNIDANQRRNVVALSGAVYDRDGQDVFYPVPDFRRFGAFGSYGIDPTAKSGRRVRTMTIDSLKIVDPISFMKIDIQGSDLFALRGAEETIRRHKMPIVFEYEEQFQQAFGTCFEDHVRFIESIDYRIKDVIYQINYLIVPR